MRGFAARKRRGRPPFERADQSAARKTQMKEGRSFITLKRKNKQAYGVLAGVFTMGLYLASNHFPIFKPALLTFTPIDHAMPFLPESIWVYFSAFVLIGIPY